MTFPQTKPSLQLTMAQPNMMQEQESFFDEPFLPDIEAGYGSVAETNRSRLDSRRRLEHLQELKRLRLEIGTDYLEDL